MHVVIACAVAAILAGLAADLAIGASLWAAGFYTEFAKAARGTSAHIGGAITSTGLVAFFVFDTLKLGLRMARKRAELIADLAHEEVEEHRTTLQRVARFYEPEHKTELLILETTDGRVCALWDESTTNIDGDRPKRSKLRLCQAMTVIIFPSSQRWTTSFTGETVRKPPAKEIVIGPKFWPRDDCWLDISFDELAGRLS